MSADGGLQTSVRTGPESSLTFYCHLHKRGLQKSPSCSFHPLIHFYTHFSKRHSAHYTAIKGALPLLWLVRLDELKVGCNIRFNRTESQHHTWILSSQHRPCIFKKIIISVLKICRKTWQCFACVSE